MAILEQLTNPKIWQEFYEYKCDDGHLSSQEMNDLKQFIENQEYETLVASIRRGDNFAFPRKQTLNKLHSQKKRTVYIFDRNESYVLKLIRGFSTTMTLSLPTIYIPFEKTAAHARRCEPLPKLQILTRCGVIKWIFTTILIPSISLS